MTMKLLIVEDSQPVCERLRAMFSGLPGLQTEVAGDVRQGTARFRETKPEMVILDVQLPDGSGLDLLGVIKQEQPATRVLMFSNYTLYRKRCVAEGADYFFDKSMDIESLTATVRQLAEVRA
jgi:DNA-binding response OmpR family regulator